MHGRSVLDSTWFIPIGSLDKVSWMACLSACYDLTTSRLIARTARIQFQSLIDLSHNYSHALSLYLFSYNLHRRGYNYINIIIIRADLMRVLSTFRLMKIITSLDYKTDLLSAWRFEILSILFVDSANLLQNLTRLKTWIKTIYQMPKVRSRLMLNFVTTAAITREVKPH